MIQKPSSQGTGQSRGRGVDMSKTHFGAIKEVSLILDSRVLADQ